jgi:hypothetical protein
MPKLDYFLVADSVSTDRERNTVSMFHILEEWSARLPLVIPELVAVSSWTIESDEMGQDFQVRLGIRLPGPQESPSFHIFPVNFTAHHRRHRAYHFVKGLRVEHAGDMVFEIFINEQLVASHVVWVRASDESE